MSRETREAELNDLTRYPSGRVRLLEAYGAICDACGTTLLPICRSMDDMIQLILKMDFPVNCYENPATIN